MVNLKFESGMKKNNKTDNIFPTHFLLSITKASHTTRYIFFFFFFFFLQQLLCTMLLFGVCVRNSALRKLKLFKAVIDVDQIHQNVNWLLVVGFHKIRSPSLFVIFIFFAFESHLRYNLVDMRL